MYNPSRETLDVHLYNTGDDGCCTGDVLEMGK